MSTYAEILAWSQTLPAWQRHALGQLATQTSITEANISQLVAMCLAESNGQPSPPGVASIAPVNLPSTGATTNAVSLAAVVASSSVNAIPDGQRLTFAPTGLTAVYGDNGAGKSGYARVLRHACQARGVGDPILSNVFNAQPGTPSAQVDYTVGTDAHSFTWRHDRSDIPEELRSVAVFDTNAAAAFIERDNEVLWTPGGIDLLIRLSSLIDEVRTRLQQEAHTLATPGTRPQVPPGTAAHSLLAKISATTTDAELDSMSLGAADQEELERLDRALAVPDPAVAAAQIRQRGQRFAALRDRIARFEPLLGEQGLSELRELRHAHQAAARAEQLLAETTFEYSQVPGVGSEPWRALWAAAEKYASSGATPDGAFPTAGSPDLCVLCQQALGAEARQRLQGFRDFVRADVATTRADAERALRQRLGAIGNLRVREASDAALLEELTTVNSEAGPGVASFLDAAATAVATVASLVSATADTALPSPLPSGWPARLQSLVDDCDRQAMAMQEAMQPDERRTATARRQELIARRDFSAGRALVDSEVARLARRAALDRAIASCVTTGITRKAGELTRTYVSDRLMTAFDEEAKNLRLPVSAKYSHSKNAKGATFQRVALEEAPWVQRAGGPVRVLSEGERRAVALAAFLAELGSRADKSGVVLDDPVSSLDHERRRAVAGRLARLATERQVVVFTHDLVFLHMLRTAATDEGAQIEEREVRKHGPASGVCRDNAPIKAMGTRALVGELKDRCQVCAASFRAGEMETYEAQLTGAFGLLREAWERAVEEVLLNGTVLRFDHRVQTQRLKHLHDITAEDLNQVEAGMTVCSNWLRGHAKAPAMNEPVPSPDELLVEVQRLESFVQALRKRGRS